MSTPDDDKLYSLLSQWDELRRQGKEVSIEALCDSRPELHAPLLELISSIEATDHLFDLEIDESPGRRLQTSVAAAWESIDSLTEVVVSSGAMSQKEIDQAISEQAGRNVASFTEELIQSGRLTEYQLQRLSEDHQCRLTLGKYVILDRIAAGGMGEVFLARHTLMNRIVALKVLAEHLTRSVSAVDRFRRETHAAARLSHPNIVTAFDADKDGETHFLVMEYIDGLDLKRTIRRDGPMTVNEALGCTLQAARALEYAHANGVIHRDVKPGNLLLDRNHTVKLLDVGLARILDPADDPMISTGSSTTALTREDAVFGTAEYMAPEQAISTRQADARSDIYSLGCTLFYLLVGRSPYASDSTFGCLVAHRETTIPRLEQLCGDVSPALAAVFTKMVAKVPNDRYQTATELIAALEGIAVSQKGPADSVRRTWLIGVVAAAAIAGITISASHVYQGSSRNSFSESHPSVAASRSASAGDISIGDDRPTSDSDATKKNVSVEGFSPSVFLTKQIPAEFEARFKNANGIVTENFAICQTMLLDEFEAVAESLRPFGYRPVKVRPFPPGLSPVQVAAIWRRDNSNWQMLTRASRAELFEAHERLQQAGYFPTDLAAHDERRPGRHVYAAVWVEGQTELAGYEFQFSRSTPQTVKAYLEEIASNGHVLCSLNRSVGSEPQCEYIVAKAVDQEADQVELFNLTLQQVRDSDPEFLNRRLITEVWTQGSGVWALSIPSQLPDGSAECRVIVDSSPESQRDQFLTMSSQGWYPVGVSVGFHQTAPLTVSAWHRNK